MHAGDEAVIGFIFNKELAPHLKRKGRELMNLLSAIYAGWKQCALTHVAPPGTPHILCNCTDALGLDAHMEAQKRSSE